LADHELAELFFGGSKLPAAAPLRSCLIPAQVMFTFLRYPVAWAKGVTVTFTDDEGSVTALDVKAANS